MPEMSQISLIAGLGNPGREYDHTRHNAGFDVIDALLAKLPGSFEETHICDSRCYTGKFRGRPLFLLKPQTFMNCSGTAVAGFARKRGIPPESILVVHDDLDLPLGRIRIRGGGSGAGGHHGVESILAELGDAGFSRLRVGIGHDGRGNTVDHVLNPVDEAEKPLWESSIAQAVEAIPEILSRGLQRAMTRFNAAPGNSEQSKQEN